MKNYVKYCVLGLSAFVIGMSVNNFAISDVPANYKVAVVDVQKVVAASSQVKALKSEQQKKFQDLNAFVKTANDAVNKEKDATKKKALQEKYSKEYNSKRAAIQKDYASKLASIDKNISSVIANKAKQDNYNLVLAKGVVLSGGTDITAEVTKLIK